MNHSLSMKSPITALKGVGPKLAQILQTKGFAQLQDILFCLPLRYEDRTCLTPIAKIFNGEKIQIEGEIISVRIQYGRKRSLLCQISVPGQGLVLGLRFYYFSKAQHQRFNVGKKIRVYGYVYKGASGGEMYHPEYQLFEDIAPPFEKELSPIYPAMTGFSQKQWRKLIVYVFDALNAVQVENYLQGLNVSLIENNLNNLTDALRVIHFPKPGLDFQKLKNGSYPGLQLLIVEELLAHYLLRKKQQDKNRCLAALPASPSSMQDNFLSQLPFVLTSAQQKVCREIAVDLASNQPMLRLLQGDVGSGKTLVAVYAALQMVAAGYQVALMVPTEILAQQHQLNIHAWLNAMQVRSACLVSSLSASQKKKILQQLQAHEIDILIGTHAIFQKDVVYAKLAFIVIDEQHRFGVHQRLALRAKNAHAHWVPHQLIMTATPIPRTLAMSLYAGVNVSTIDELPQGRQSIDTLLMKEERRSQLFARIAHACQQGKQVYWVCTLIENSELIDNQAVEDTLQMLRVAMPQLNIAQLHGKMKSAEKHKTMDLFMRGEIAILIATTVVEVGLDVPNASIIVIENAERLGLAQLHQLRGRVGRGSEKSYCVLLYSKKTGAMGRARLNAIRQYQDGFLIAEEDLRLRGPGDFFGVRQSGEMSMRIADLQRDSYLLEDVKKIAEQVAQQYPQRIDKIVERWLPNAQHYAHT